MSTEWIDGALPIFSDHRGTLAVAEGEDLPFPVARIYWIESMPPGVWRGGHAHKELRQVVFALRGRFKIEVQDGRGGHRSYEITPKARPLHIGSGLWRDFCALDSGGILLVAASHRYNPSDYIRSRTEFENWANGQESMELP